MDSDILKVFDERVPWSSLVLSIAVKCSSTLMSLWLNF